MAVYDRARFANAIEPQASARAGPRYVTVRECATAASRVIRSLAVAVRIGAAARTVGQSPPQPGPRFPLSNSDFST